MNKLVTGIKQLLEKSSSVSPFHMALGAIVLGGIVLSANGQLQLTEPVAENLEDAVLPKEGITLPVQWGDLGVQLVAAGVIEYAKWEQLYAKRGGMLPEEQRFLTQNVRENITMTNDNAGFFLNLFWALGLGTQNEILEKGPMSNPAYGNAGNFASTGGWSLAQGNAMDHYSKHPFIRLNSQQQALIAGVSQNIYRPCCNNPVYFPDCNHGMAMLGLLELLASQGVQERDMYRYALQVNAYWFPDTYLTIAAYFAKKGIPWSDVDPKEALGPNYSSASGFRKILEEVTPPAGRNGGSCGV